MRVRTGIADPESVRAKPTRLPRRFAASPVSRERGRSKKNAKSQSMRGRELYKLAVAVFFGWRSPATSPRQLARSAAGDCQFSPTEPVKLTKRAHFGLYLIVHAHKPLRDWMRSTTSTGTESRGHQSTPDHGGVPPCCLPVIRRNVPADAARSITHAVYGAERRLAAASGAFRHAMLILVRYGFPRPPLAVVVWCLWW